MAPILGYWDVRGLGESIRYLLHYAGVEFEDKRYTFGPAGSEFLGDWAPVKHGLGLELPNLPYYIDEDVKITQNAVILRYLARKHGLYLPEGGDKESLRLDMVEGSVRDLFQALFLVVTNPEVEKMKGFVLPKLNGMMEQLSKFIGDHEWLLGDKISHVDFSLFEILEFWRLLLPNLLDDHPTLQRLHKKFAELPKIKAYRQTSKKWPLLAPVSTWGGKGDPPSHIDM